MVARLGEIACERGMSRVVLSFLPSSRNTPAKNFLSTLATATHLTEGAQQQYVLAARNAASIVFVPREQVTDNRLSKETSMPMKGFANSKSLAEIAKSLSNVSDIRKAVNSVAEPAIVSSSAVQSSMSNSVLEQTIARVICESLGIKDVGVDDNFFDLGAHSSVLVQVAGKLEEQMGKELPVIKFFQFPTVAGLAQHLSIDTNQPTAGRKNRLRGEKQRQILMRMRQSQALEA